MPSTKLGFEMQELVINPFKMHLSDAILAVHLASEGTTIREVKAMLSRTAVAHAVFAIECAANCFLTRIPRNHRFRDQAEMWPAIDKFDLFLLSLPNCPQLPRDDKRLKHVRDLFRFRDRHVHSRTIHYSVYQPNTDAHFGVKMPGNQFIPMQPVSFAWSEADGLTAIKAALAFLRLVVELSGLSSLEVEQTLNTFAECGDGRRAVDLGNFDKALTLATTLGIDLAFLFPTLPPSAPDA
jgi:hypothetical protein